MRLLVRLLALACPVMGLSTVWADEPAKPKPGLTVWDTKQPSSQPLAPGALAGKNDWPAITVGQNLGSFQGDAVVSTGRLAVVLRKQDRALEIHGLTVGSAEPRLRLRLETAKGELAERLVSAALTENARGSATLDASFATAKGETVGAKFRIKRGDVIVQAEPGPGAAKLHVVCPGRFAVLPDFFADDITVDATRLALESADLPSENFVLHLTGGGNALGACVFETRQQDVKVMLAGSAEKRVVTGSVVPFEGKKVWVALLEAPHIWHTHDLTAADTGKIVPLGWKAPFPAQWRMDFTRSNDLTDSWEMLLEQSNGDFVKPSWLGAGEERLGSNRSRWNTVLGRYPYPCWLNADGQGFVQPVKSRVLALQGPMLLYPINRVKQTPLDAYTLVDVMRNTLGVGPCEHILDLEGQKAEYKGRATCSVRDTLTPIYANHQQKEKRELVNKTLDEGLAFVKHIRGRITRYVEFGQKLRQYLGEQRKAHPELADFIAEMDQLTQEIDKRVAARVDKIQTPEHVARMNEAFRKNVLGYDGADATERCKAYTHALVVIGDNQDELSGECRWAIKTLRQRAGVRMALDPRVAAVAAEIRARTQDTLRNPASHEGARH